MVRDYISERNKYPMSVLIVFSLFSIKENDPQAVKNKGNSSERKSKPR